jgi:predicted acyltransferase
VRRIGRLDRAQPVKRPRIQIQVRRETQERRWTYFFEVFGRNTLAIYLLAELGQIVLETIHIGQITSYEWLWATGFAPWAGDKPGSLLCAVAYMLGFWLVAYAMDRKRIYIKL